MSKVTDCKRSADSASRKRRQSSEQDESASNTSRKVTKVGNARNETPSTSSQSHKNGNAEKPEEPAGKQQAAEHREEEAGDVKAAAGKENSSGSNGAPTTDSSERQDGPESVRQPHDGPESAGQDAPESAGQQQDAPESVRMDGPDDDPSSNRVTTAEKAQGSDAAKADAEGEHCPSTSLDHHQSDSAAIAAAEALASLTGGKGKEGEETPCSSDRAGRDRPGGKVKRTNESSKGSSKTQAAAADSSTSVHSIERDAAEDIGHDDDGDDSIPGSSSTPSSSFPSDNETNDGSECAIVSVKMAPEIRQSVALLAQVQMRLEALEKKSARLHQRLDLKMSRQQRPHLDQRSSITQGIPGFWVTALLNHPHLSAHIDETDEDALSYMTDLEIESFKGQRTKVGHRIRFHFKRNPYFQNNIIMKEVHVGMGGPPVSFSNPILWHRGQNLTAHSEPRKSSRGVYQTFFSWFSDHSNPGRDDIAQILKDDLWRDPLRYYLTPLWEPRENGSSSSGTRAPDNSNRDECVVISDSDDDQEQDEADDGHSREEDEDGEDEEDERGQDSDESQEDDEDGQIMTDGSDDREDEDEEDEKDEDVYVEELDDSMDHKTRDPNDDEDVEVDEEDDSKD